MSAIACVDIGSTYTKAALVALPSGELLATGQSPTTLDDVVRGVLAATDFALSEVDNTVGNQGTRYYRVQLLDPSP